jgi:hypothetical protein
MSEPAAPSPSATPGTEEPLPASQVEAAPSAPSPLATQGPVAAAPAKRSGPEGDYRDLLGSRRWDAAPLRNPEVEKTDPRIALAAIVILAAATLLVLVAGYASGFWTLPEGGGASAAVAALELLA